MNNEHATPLTKPRSDLLEPPGGVLVWIIVVFELITFGAGISVFVIKGDAHTIDFEAGRALLNQPIALANTMILLTGGWCMVNAIEALRAGCLGPCRRWLALTIFTGIAFLWLKSMEYVEKVQHGIAFGEDTFFTLYWLLTGFHFLHVVAAIIMLTVMWLGIHRGKYGRDDYQDVESSGIFWHMCNLIWLLLYPAIYLVR